MGVTAKGDDGSTASRAADRSDRTTRASAATRITTRWSLPATPISSTTRVRASGSTDTMVPARRAASAPDPSATTHAAATTRAPIRALTRRLTSGRARHGPGIDEEPIHQGYVGPRALDLVLHEGPRRFPDRRPVDGSLQRDDRFRPRREWDVGRGHDRVPAHHA